MTENTPNSGCNCGKVQFNVSGPPLFRAFCHCTICQAYNQAPFADITLFRSKDVTKPIKENVNFRSHKFPPILQRGNCVSCDKAVIEYLRMFPIPQIIIVPSYNIRDNNILPTPALHMFYDTRVEDIQDNLPKYSGFFRSQYAFSSKLLASLFLGSRK